MPWPKGKPRSLETKLKLSKDGTTTAEKSICKCGGKKDPYTKMCFKCYNQSGRRSIVSSMPRPNSRGVKKSKEHRLKISESNTGKHNHYGSMNPNWRGGISKTSHLIRSNQKYRDWQENVKAKYKNKCAICKESIYKRKIYKIKGYACHHIVPLKQLISEAINKNKKAEPIEACLKYDKIWDTDNGMLLHKYCHIELHKKLSFKVTK